MQLNQPLNSITRSTIATMSANDLKHVLELDCMSQGTDSLDIDTIMYIMEVIAQKEKEPTIEIDAQSAQREFETTYLQSLQTESPAPAHIQKQQPTKKRRSFKRYWLVAAIVALLICAMSVSASAFEWNIFKLFASWTEDTFQFVSSPVTGEEWGDDDDSPLAEFEALMVDGARCFGVSIAALEHATRTVIKDIWNSNNQGALETLFGRKLYKPFSNGQFLSNAILFMALESAQKKQQEGTPINRPENISAQIQKEAPKRVPLS